jgi:hypothetical protein
VTELWRPIPGYEGRYEVSDQGRVASVPFMQRYVMCNGVEGFRQTKGKPLAQQVINSGYLIVHLHRDNKRTACTVHRLVARAFLGEPAPSLEVNHKDLHKANNRVENLEWVTRTANHIHAVYGGVHTLAARVEDPLTGAKYPSMREASRLCGLGEKYVRNHFIRLENHV